MSKTTETQTGSCLKIDFHQIFMKIRVKTLDCMKYFFHLFLRNISNKIGSHRQPVFFFDDSFLI